MARQSGRWTGRIRGGRAEIRQALYMPALVAARFNPDLGAKYKKLTSGGKPAKVALIAVMRKLIVLANDEGQSKLVAKIRLIKTDTLAREAGKGG
jgi:transposase